MSDWLKRIAHRHGPSETHFVALGGGFGWWQDVCDCGMTRQRQTGGGLGAGSWTIWMQRLPRTDDRVENKR